MSFDSLPQNTRQSFKAPQLGNPRSKHVEAGQRADDEVLTLPERVLLDCRDLKRVGDHVPVGQLDGFRQSVAVAVQVSLAKRGSASA